MSALSSLFEQFLRERRFLKNVTPKTITWYETAFDSFTRTVSVTEPGDLSKPVLQAFVVRLRERGLSHVAFLTERERHVRLTPLFNAPLQRLEEMRGRRGPGKTVPDPRGRALLAPGFAGPSIVVRRHRSAGSR